MDGKSVVEEFLYTNDRRSEDRRPMGRYQSAAHWRREKGGRGPSGFPRTTRAPNLQTVLKE